MKISIFKIVIVMLVIVSFDMTGCGKKTEIENIVSQEKKERIVQEKIDNVEHIELSNKVITLDSGLKAVTIKGNDGFEQFLEAGGAKNDVDIVSYLKENFLKDTQGISFGVSSFGCSTLLAKSKNDGYYFGRNFDWERCEAMIVRSQPEKGYASISTVNTQFIQSGGTDVNKLPDEVQALLGIYAPLDGMNEKGLTVAVNMIQDGETISQDTGKKDITTTTAVRLLLNQAANVQEAIELLKNYDMHASKNMMIHFAIADADGKSVAVEYIDDQMSVVETKILTNFYVTEGKKYGIGTNQSHDRYKILKKALENHDEMTVEDVRDALDSVSKNKFQDVATTEWSIVFDLTKKEATYYHRENYTKGYKIDIE